MKEQNMKSNDTMLGIIYAAGAFVVWGILPIYWKLLNQVSAGEIFAHRIIWSFVFVFGILIYQKRLGLVKEMIFSKHYFIRNLISALFISANWFIYIWAVNSNNIVEASMGYYINPLILILLGMVVFKEKLGFWKTISVISAAIGVLIMTIQYGKVPWIALGLALSFALYGLMKKMVNIDSIIGLAIETLMITPICLIYIIFKESSGSGALSILPFSKVLLLLCSGVATATPLIWFAKGAKRIPLNMLGFFQYIAPTISLFLGVFLYKEQFTRVHLFSFGFIWIGITIYSLSQMNILKDKQSNLIEKEEN